MSRGASNGEFCVTARGMVASLGYDAHTNAAAVRAGLSGGQELEHYTIRSPVNGDVERIIGYVVPDFTHGFGGPARLLRLVQGALSDFVRQARPDSWRSARVGFYVSLPDPRRPLSATDLIADDDRRRQAEQRVADAEEYEAPPEPADALAGRLLAAAGKNVRWGRSTELRFVTTSGHTGVAEAVRAATADLAGGRVDMAVVGGFDSLVDRDTLFWLENAGRLKSSGVPDGVPPGEAGALFLLETTVSAAGRGARPLALLKQCVLEEDPTPRTAKGVPLGRGLASAVLALAQQSQEWMAAPAFWVVTDHNGESYRAMDWGGALARLAGADRFFADPVTWFPAASLGDTGAASGAVAACVAAAAFERNYAPSPLTALLSSSDGPGRAAFLLAAAPDALVGR